MPTFDLSKPAAKQVVKKKKKQYAPASTIAGTEGRGGVTPLDVQEKIGRPGVQVPKDAAAAVLPKTPLVVTPTAPLHGVEDYVPTPGTVAKLPKDIELRLQQQAGGPLDNTLKNLIQAHYEVFGAYPNFSLTTDILDSGEVEFPTLESARTFFQSVKASYEASGKEWQLDAQGNDTLLGDQYRKEGRNEFTQQTDILDPEMLASFNPKNIDDLLYGPYMKHDTPNRKNDMFRDGRIRLDDMLIELPKQWAISQLSNRLSDRATRSNPDRDQDEQLMEDLNNFIASRVPKELAPAATAAWQNKTEEGLRYIQMMRASSLYVASNGKDHDAAAFLQTQGYSDIINTLEEQIRMPADPTGRADAQKRAWIQQWYVDSRNPGVSERQAVHELGDLNLNAVTVEGQKMIGMDHLGGYAGAISGWFNDIPVLNRLDDEVAKVVQSDEFHKATSWAIPIAADIANVIKPVVSVPAHEFSWAMEKYNDYFDAFMNAARESQDSVLGLALKTAAFPAWGAGRGPNQTQNAFAAWLTLAHRAFGGDVEWIGDFTEKFNDTMTRKKQGLKAGFTDDILRDMGLSPETHPELAFLADFACDTARDIGIAKVAGVAAAAIKGTDTFIASERLAGTVLHERTVAQTATEMFLKDVSERADESVVTGGLNTGAKAEVKRIINHDKFAGEMAEVFGVDPTDAASLARKMRGAYEKGAGEEELGNLVHEELPKFAKTGRGPLRADSWGLHYRVREAALTNPDSIFYIGKHPHLSPLLERMFRNPEWLFDDDHAPEEVRKLGTYYRTALKNADLDDLKARAVGLARTDNNLELEFAIREVKDVNELSATMQGLYADAPAWARSTLGLADDADPEQWLSLARTRRLKLAQHVDEDLGFYHLKTPADASFAKRFWKRHPDQAAQWNERAKNLLGEDTPDDFLPRAAEYRYWRDLQSMPEDRLSDATPAVSDGEAVVNRGVGRYETGEDAPLYHVRQGAPKTENGEPAEMSVARDYNEIEPQQQALRSYQERIDGYFREHDLPTSEELGKLEDDTADLRRSLRRSTRADKKRVAKVREKFQTYGERVTALGNIQDVIDREKAALENVPKRQAARQARKVADALDEQRSLAILAAQDEAKALESSGGDMLKAMEILGIKRENLSQLQDQLHGVEKTIHDAVIAHMRAPVVTSEVWDAAEKEAYEAHEAALQNVGQLEGLVRDFASDPNSAPLGQDAIAILTGRLEEAQQTELRTLGAWQANRARATQARIALYQHRLPPALRPKVTVVTVGKVTLEKGVEGVELAKVPLSAPEFSALMPPQTVIDQAALAIVQNPKEAQVANSILAEWYHEQLVPHEVPAAEPRTIALTGPVTPEMSDQTIRTPQRAIDVLSDNERGIPFSDPPPAVMPSNPEFREALTQVHARALSRGSITIEVPEIHISPEGKAKQWGHLRTGEVAQVDTAKMAEVRDESFYEPVYKVVEREDASKVKSPSRSDYLAPGEYFDEGQIPFTPEEEGIEAEKIKFAQHKVEQGLGRILSGFIDSTMEGSLPVDMDYARLVETRRAALEAINPRAVAENVPRLQEKAQGLIDELKDVTGKLQRARSEKSKTKWSTRQQEIRDELKSINDKVSTARKTTREVMPVEEPASAVEITHAAVPPTNKTLTDALKQKTILQEQMRSSEAEAMQAAKELQEHLVATEEISGRYQANLAILNNGTAHNLNEDAVKQLREICALVRAESPDLTPQQLLDNLYKEFDPTAGVPFKSAEWAIQTLNTNPEELLRWTAQPSREWQLQNHYRARYNYAKVAKFEAGGPVRRAEALWSNKFPVMHFSIDDATTAYKVLVMMKVSTMLRIPLADEFTRFFTEGINPLEALKEAKSLRAIDKLPQDVQFKLSELVRQTTDGPWQLLDYTHPHAFNYYRTILQADRRDPTYARYLMGKQLQKQNPGELERRIDAFLSTNERGNLESVVQYYRNAANETLRIHDDARYADQILKAWYATGYREGGGLRRIGVDTHRVLRLGADKGDVSYSGPEWPKNAGVTGDQWADARNLPENLIDYYEWWNNHETLGADWHPNRAFTADEMTAMDSRMQMPESIEFPVELDKFGNPSKDRWNQMSDLIRSAKTQEDKQKLIPGIVGRDTGNRTGGLQTVKAIRDAFYGILDYSGAKMNEAVFAHAYKAERDLLVAKGMADEVADRQAIFYAREYTHRIMFNNATYMGEDMLRNIFLFLPAYRQFLEYWVPKLMTSPALASFAYRANRDKAQFQNAQVGPLNFDLSKMTFLINQGDNRITGWLPSGAPLIVMPVSMLAMNRENDPHSVWGNLAGSWPFDFAGSYMPLNSPLDKLFYAATGQTAPWPFGSDGNKNPWRELQMIRSAALKGEDMSAGQAHWKNRLNHLVEGGWNFFVPVGMKVKDDDVQAMIEARQQYNAATSPEELEKILSDPKNATFKTFIEWQNKPSYEQMDFLKAHPEIVPYMVSGYQGKRTNETDVAFLWSKMRDIGVADPAGYTDRLDKKYQMINKVIEAMDARKSRDAQDKWWDGYKKLHGDDHDFYRLQNEYYTSTGAFAPGGFLYQQGHVGQQAMQDKINTKFVGITDPFTGISNYDGDAYRFAKLLDESGGAAKKLLQMSPNYEMYELQKLKEHTHNVTALLDSYAETRMTTRFTPEQIKSAGYNAGDTAEIQQAVGTIDKLWDGADQAISRYGKYGYATTEGRAIRKKAIETQNKIIDSSPLLKEFLGNNIAAMYGKSYLTKPVWQRQDFVKLDAMDPTEREMFYHLTTEKDPETNRVRWNGLYLPEGEKKLIQNAKVLGYVPTKDGWKTRVQIGEVTGLIDGKTPKEAGTIDLTMKRMYEAMKGAFDAAPDTVQGDAQWYAKMKRSLPSWAQDLVEEGIRAEAWKLWLNAATVERKNLRTTINEYYGNAPGFSMQSKYGMTVKKRLLGYGTLLGRITPAFAKEYREYNGNNEMVNSILGWYL